MGGGAMMSGLDEGRGAQYTGKGMTAAVFLVAVVAASGGLIFGYDNGISGYVGSYLSQF